MLKTRGQKKFQQIFKRFKLLWASFEQILFFNTLKNTIAHFGNKDNFSSDNLIKIKIN